MLALECLVLKFMSDQKLDAKELEVWSWSWLEKVWVGKERRPVIGWCSSTGDGSPHTQPPEFCWNIVMGDGKRRRRNTRRGGNSLFHPFKSVGVTLFRVTKEQDTSDSEMKMSLATVPLPQEHHLELLSSSADLMRMFTWVLLALWIGCPNYVLRSGFCREAKHCHESVLWYCYFKEYHSLAP